MHFTHCESSSRILRWSRSWLESCLWRLQRQLILGRAFCVANDKCSLFVVFFFVCLCVESTAAAYPDFVWWGFSEAEDYMSLIPQHAGGEEGKSSWVEQQKTVQLSSSSYGILILQNLFNLLRRPSIRPSVLRSGIVVEEIFYSFFKSCLPMVTLGNCKKFVI